MDAAMLLSAVNPVVFQAFQPARQLGGIGSQLTQLLTDRFELRAPRVVGLLIRYEDADCGSSYHPALAAKNLQCLLCSPERNRVVVRELPISGKLNTGPQSPSADLLFDLLSNPLVGGQSCTVGIHEGQSTETDRH